MGPHTTGRQHNIRRTSFEIASALTTPSGMEAYKPLLSTEGAQAPGGGVGGAPPPPPSVDDALAFAGFRTGRREWQDKGWGRALVACGVLAVVLGGVAASSANPRYDQLTSATSLKARARARARDRGGAGAARGWLCGLLLGAWTRLPRPRSPLTRVPPPPPPRRPTPPATPRRTPAAAAPCSAT